MKLATTFEPEAAPPPRSAVPLLSLLDKEPQDENTLLGHRFLCREGGMLFVGPSGIGKSSASVQQDICWSIGQPAFGIVPARPLRILEIQAENDEGDLHEMVRGVWNAMRFGDEAAALCTENLLVLSEKARTGSEFLNAVVQPILEMHRPDVLRIDPLLAFLGDDPTDTKALSAFCRNGLNPLLEQYNCAAILNHHTPKTTNRDTSAWRASDWMYSGAGGADLTNWARAVFVIEPTDNPIAFRFIGAKRGKRMGWRDEDGNTEYQRIYCHSENSIAWREATPEEQANARPRNAKGTLSDEELMAFIPATGTVPKNELLERWNSKGMGEKKCKAKLNVLLADGMVFEWSMPRAGTRPELHISRHEQPLV